MVRKLWMERKLEIMKVYGYKKNSDEFIELQEASIECSIAELDKIIEFLKYSRDQHYKVKNEADICHSHYRDWDKDWKEEKTDIILVTTFNK